MKVQKWHALPLLTSLVVSPAASAKDYGFLPHGKWVTCAEATEYRDTELVKEYDLLDKDYASGKAARQKIVREELNKHLDALLKDWDRKGAKLRKERAGEGVALALATASFATGKWLNTRQGMSETNRRVAEHLVERGATLTAVVEKSVTTGKVDSWEIASMPIGLVAPLIPVVGPAIATGMFTWTTGKSVIDTRIAFAEYALAEKEYQGEAQTLRAAIERLALRSVENQLAGLNALKTQIDRTCN